MPEKKFFNEKEQAIFDNEWGELVSTFSPDQPGERIRALFERNRPFILECAQYSKAQFKGETFYGLEPVGGFGWSLLRPQHLRRLTTDTGTTNADWRRTVTAPGYNYYIGTAAAFAQINRRACVVILGVHNHSPSPKSVGALLQVSSISYPPFDFINAMRAYRSSKIWGLPKPKYIPALEQLTLRMYDDATGLDEPQILGITFAESGYLQLQNPALEAP